MLRFLLKSNKVMLCLLVSALIVKNVPFGGLFSVMVFAFLCLLLVLSLFIMAPKCSTEVLSSIHS